MAHSGIHSPRPSPCGHKEVPAGLFTPAPGRDEGPRPVSRVAVRRSWPVRTPVPFSGQLFPWPAFGTPGVAECRSDIEFYRGWREPRIPHRGPGAWPFPSFAAWCGVLGLCALESGSAGFHTRGGSPAWLPALLVSARPVASASWAGARLCAWPSSGWLASVWPWVLRRSSCGALWISWYFPGVWAP